MSMPVNPLRLTSFHDTHKTLYSNGDVWSDYGDECLTDVISRVAEIRRADLGTVFFTSDTHFGHQYIASLRGFEKSKAGAQEHDRWIAECWNSVVSENDVVVHLGDVTSDVTGPLKVLHDLNGAKILLPGNHDKVWSRRGKPKAVDAYLDVFDAIITKGSCWLSWDKQVILSHIPPYVEGKSEEEYRDSSLAVGSLPVIHGHLHDDVLGGVMLNVGVDHFPAPISVAKALFLSGLDGIGGLSPLSNAELRELNK